MTEWYEVVCWRDDIRPVQVERTTEKCVWVMSGRMACRIFKVGQTAHYFPLRTLARDYLIARLTQKAEGLRSDLARAESRLNELRGGQHD